MITSITIPLRLVSEANSKEHWAKKSRRHREQKMVIRAHLPSKPVALPCTVTLIRAAPRKFDADNLQGAFKWITDAIAEWLTDVDIPGLADSDDRITWKYEQKKTTDKQHFITIEIESENYQSLHLTEILNLR